MSSPSSKKTQAEWIAAGLDLFRDYYIGVLQKVLSQRTRKAGDVDVGASSSTANAPTSTKSPTPKEALQAERGLFGMNALQRSINKGEKILSASDDSATAPVPAIAADDAAALWSTEPLAKYFPSTASASTRTQKTAGSTGAKQTANNFALHQLTTQTEDLPLWHLLQLERLNRKDAPGMLNKATSGGRTTGPAPVTSRDVLKLVDKVCEEVLYLRIADFLLREFTDAGIEDPLTLFSKNDDTLYLPPDPAKQDKATRPLYRAARKSKIQIAQNALWALAIYADSLEEDKKKSSPADTAGAATPTSPAATTSSTSKCYRIDFSSRLVFNPKTAQNCFFIPAEMRLVAEIQQVLAGGGSSSAAGNSNNLTPNAGNSLLYKIKPVLFSLSISKKDQSTIVQQEQTYFGADQVISSGGQQLVQASTGINYGNNSSDDLYGSLAATNSSAVTNIIKSGSAQQYNFTFGGTNLLGGTAGGENVVEEQQSTQQGVIVAGGGPPPGSTNAAQMNRQLVQAGGQQAASNQNDLAEPELPHDSSFVEPATEIAAGAPAVVGGTSTSAEAAKNYKAMRFQSAVSQDFGALQQEQVLATSTQQAGVAAQLPVASIKPVAVAAIEVPTIKLDTVDGATGASTVDAKEAGTSGAQLNLDKLSNDLLSTMEKEKAGAARKNYSTQGGFAGGRGASSSFFAPRGRSRGRSRSRSVQELLGAEGDENQNSSKLEEEKSSSKTRAMNKRQRKRLTQSKTRSMDSPVIIPLTKDRQRYSTDVKDVTVAENTQHAILTQQQRLARKKETLQHMDRFFQIVDHMELLFERSIDHLKEDRDAEINNSTKGTAEVSADGNTKPGSSMAMSPRLAAADGDNSAAITDLRITTDQAQLTTTGDADLDKELSAELAALSTNIKADPRRRTLNEEEKLLKQAAAEVSAVNYNLADEDISVMNVNTNTDTDVDTATRMTATAGAATTVELGIIDEEETTDPRYRAFLKGTSSAKSSGPLLFGRPFQEEQPYRDKRELFLSAAQQRSESQKRKMMALGGHLPWTSAQDAESTSPSSAESSAREDGGLGLDGNIKNSSSPKSVKKSAPPIVTTLTLQQTPQSTTRTLVDRTRAPMLTNTNVNQKFVNKRGQLTVNRPTTTWLLRREANKYDAGAFVGSKTFQKSSLSLTKERRDRDREDLRKFQVFQKNWRQVRQSQVGNVVDDLEKMRDLAKGIVNEDEVRSVVSRTSQHQAGTSTVEQDNAAAPADEGVDVQNQIGQQERSPSKLLRTEVATPGGTTAGAAPFGEINKPTTRTTLAAQARSNSPELVRRQVIDLAAASAGSTTSMANSLQPPIIMKQAFVQKENFIGVCEVQPRAVRNGSLQRIRKLEEALRRQKFLLESGSVLQEEREEEDISTSGGPPSRAAAGLKQIEVEKYFQNLRGSGKIQGLEQSLPTMEQQQQQQPARGRGRNRRNLLMSSSGASKKPANASSQRRALKDSETVVNGVLALTSASVAEQDDQRTESQEANLPAATETTTSAQQQNRSKSPGGAAPAALAERTKNNRGRGGPASLYSKSRSRSPSGGAAETRLDSSPEEENYKFLLAMKEVAGLLDQVETSQQTHVAQMLAQAARSKDSEEESLSRDPRGRSYQGRLTDPSRDLPLPRRLRPRSYTPGESLARRAAKHAEAEEKRNERARNAPHPKVVRAGGNPTARKFANGLRGGDDSGNSTTSPLQQMKVRKEGSGTAEVAEEQGAAAAGVADDDASEDARRTSKRNSITSFNADEMNEGGDKNASGSAAANATNTTVEAKSQKYFRPIQFYSPVSYSNRSRSVSSNGSLYRPRSASEESRRFVQNLSKLQLRSPTSSGSSRSYFENSVVVRRNYDPRKVERGLQDDQVVGRNERRDEQHEVDNVVMHKKGGIATISSPMGAGRRSTSPHHGTRATTSRSTAVRGVGGQAGPKRRSRNSNLVATKAGTTATSTSGGSGAKTSTSSKPKPPSASPYLLYYQETPTDNYSDEENDGLEQAAKQQFLSNNTSRSKTSLDFGAGIKTANDDLPDDLQVEDEVHVDVGLQDRSTHDELLLNALDNLDASCASVRQLSHDYFLAASNYSVSACCSRSSSRHFANSTAHSKSSSVLVLNNDSKKSSSAEEVGVEQSSSTTSALSLTRRGSSRDSSAGQVHLSAAATEAVTAQGQQGAVADDFSSQQVEVALAEGEDEDHDDDSPSSLLSSPSSLSPSVKNNLFLYYGEESESAQAQQDQMDEKSKRKNARNSRRNAREKTPLDHEQQVDGEKTLMQEEKQEPEEQEIFLFMPPTPVVEQEYTADQIDVEEEHPNDPYYYENQDYENYEQDQDQQDGNVSEDHFEHMKNHLKTGKHGDSKAKKILDALPDHHRDTLLHPGLHTAPPMKPPKKKKRRSESSLSADGGGSSSSPGNQQGQGGGGIMAQLGLPNEVQGFVNDLLQLAPCDACEDPATVRAAVDVDDADEETKSGLMPQLQLQQLQTASEHHVHHLTDPDVKHMTEAELAQIMGVYGAEALHDSRNWHATPRKESKELPAHYTNPPAPPTLDMLNYADPPSEQPLEIIVPEDLPTMDDYMRERTHDMLDQLNREVVTTLRGNHFQFKSDTSPPVSPSANLTTALTAPTSPLAGMLLTGLRKPVPLNINTTSSAVLDLEKLLQESDLIERAYEISQKLKQLRSPTNVEIVHKRSRSASPAGLLGGAAGGSARTTPREQLLRAAPEVGVSSLSPPVLLRGVGVGGGLGTRLHRSNSPPGMVNMMGGGLNAVVQQLPSSTTLRGNTLTLPSNVLEKAIAEQRERFSALQRKLLLEHEALQAALQVRTKSSELLLRPSKTRTAATVTAAASSSPTNLTSSSSAARLNTAQLPLPIETNAIRNRKYGPRYLFAEQAASRKDFLDFQRRQMIAQEKRLLTASSNMNSPSSRNGDRERLKLELEMLELEKEYDSAFYPLGDGGRDSTSYDFDPAARPPRSRTSTTTGAGRRGASPAPYAHRSPDNERMRNLRVGSPALLLDLTDHKMRQMQKTAVQFQQELEKYNSPTVKEAFTAEHQRLLQAGALTSQINDSGRGRSSRSRSPLVVVPTAGAAAAGVGRSITSGMPGAHSSTLRAAMTTTTTTSKLSHKNSAASPSPSRDATLIAKFQTEQILLRELEKVRVRSSEQKQKVVVKGGDNDKGGENIGKPDEAVEDEDSPAVEVPTAAEILGAAAAAAVEATATTGGRAALNYNNLVQLSKGSTTSAASRAALMSSAKQSKNNNILINDEFLLQLPTTTNEPLSGLSLDERFHNAQVLSPDLAVPMPQRPIPKREVDAAFSPEAIQRELDNAGAARAQAGAPAAAVSKKASPKPAVQKKSAVVVSAPELPKSQAEMERAKAREDRKSRASDRLAPTEMKIKGAK
ncbi:unnamed protein product [Amoebophrya sp. A120]|nr:unnamed protein product [Amoebophrya sp. A120]|eukprot:GSA120T00001217001.1